TPKTTRISLQPGDGAGSGAKPAGPALSGDANHVAIAGGNAATLFKRSVAIDDRVFLAIANPQHSSCCRDFFRAASRRCGNKNGPPENSEELGSVAAEENWCSALAEE